MYPYTFDKTAEVVEAFLEEKGYNRFGLYVQDYRGPVGFRILQCNPEWMEWLIIQNTNAYETGFTWNSSTITILISPCIQNGKSS